MRQDEVMINILKMIKNKQYDNAKSLIDLHYPTTVSKNYKQVLLTEGAQLNLPITTIRSFKQTKSVSKRKSFSTKERDFIFLRDRYQCRYSGLKLFAPPVLAIVSIYLENSFPCFKIPHYPLHSTHVGFYTLFPAIDHKDSLHNGGSNEVENMITSSQTLNLIKSHSSLEEMNWSILNMSSLDKSWDGGRKWFLKIISNKKEFQNIVSKAILLGTFHNHINPEKYFLKWKNAIISNDSNPVSFEEKNEIKTTKKKNTENTILPIKPAESEIQEAHISTDLKELPIGTICRNIATQNRYVILYKSDEEAIYFSDKENSIFKIKTKPLKVQVELQLEPLFSSILDIPSFIYNVEQIEFLKKAFQVWNRKNSMRPTTILAGSIYDTIFN